MTTSSVNPSGLNRIDSLLTGVKWGSSTGNGATVTYSFMNQIPDYMNPQNGAFTVVIDSQLIQVGNFVVFNNNQISGAEAAQRLISKVANVTFDDEPDSNSVDIRFGTGDPSTSLLGFAFSPGDNEGGDIWLANDDSRNLIQTPGSIGFWVMLHEIGHALGLKHPFKGSDTLPSTENNRQYTMMSYNLHPGSDVEPSTPMLYDIAALQYIYGANFGTHTENNTYSWNPNTAFLQAIWDAGGIDTISAANQTFDAVINLNNGSFSSIGPRSDGSSTAATDNLAIAFEVQNSNGVVVNIIENAEGGLGNDTLIGNRFNNYLNGNGGNDTLDGGTGSNRLSGGAGNDTYIISANHNDTVEGFGGIGKGADPSNAILANLDVLKFQGTGLTAQTLFLTQKGQNLEITFEGVSDVKVVLENFALENLDNITRTTGNLGNILFDGETSIQDSFDVFDADSTQDTVFKENKVTFLNDLNNNVKGFDNSNDVINGQGGNDRIDGRSGNDLLRGSTGKDTLLGGKGEDALNGGEGDDTLVGGFDSDVLFGGSGKDKFTFNSKSEGLDIIVDFSVVDDVIQVSKSGFGGGLAKGTLKSSQFHLGSSASDSSDRFLYDQTFGSLFFDSDGTGSKAKIQIAQLSSGLAMTHNDIYVIA